MREYIAVVDRVIYKGKHGLPYAFAISEEIGTVTFSLHNNVWQEPEFPEPGMYVVLSKIRRKRAGWRAYSARFLVPEDLDPQKKGGDK